MLQEAGSFAGILEWTIELSLDIRKGPVIVENSVFESAEAVERFRLSDEHRHVGEFLSQIADWVVGDYVERS